MNNHVHKVDFMKIRCSLVTYAIYRRAEDQVLEVGEYAAEDGMTYKKRDLPALRDKMNRAARDVASAMLAIMPGKEFRMAYRAWLYAQEIWESGKCKSQA